MLNLTDIFNDITTEVLIRKTIRRVISTLYDNSDVKYMCSNLVFQGYLINIILKETKFNVFLIGGRYHIWTLYHETTNYSLINFIKHTRAWLSEALTNSQSLCNPCFFAKNFDIKRHENFIAKRGLTISQIQAIKSHSEIISYL